MNRTVAVQLIRMKTPAHCSEIPFGLPAHFRSLFAQPYFLIGTMFFV